MARKRSEETEEKNQKAADSSGTETVDSDGSVEVVKVEHPGEDADEEFLKSQDEAYLHYRATGQVGTYIDPLRDQEPDIAPELGVAPHPELANPVPPPGVFTGNALSPESNPVVVPVEEKQENAENAVEAFQEQAAEIQAAADEAAEAEENGEASPDFATAAEEGQIAGRVQDESPQSSASDVRRQA